VTKEAPVVDLGAFEPLPPATLDKLISKGREDARQLDEAIRSQFEMTAADAAMRLR
jgi:hypothetical protein